MAKTKYPGEIARFHTFEDGTVFTAHHLPKKDSKVTGFLLMGSSTSKVEAVKDMSKYLPHLGLSMSVEELLNHPSWQYIDPVEELSKISKNSGSQVPRISSGAYLIPARETLVRGSRGSHRLDDGDRSDWILGDSESYTPSSSTDELSIFSIHPLLIRINNDDFLTGKNSWSVERYITSNRKEDHSKLLNEVFNNMTQSQNTRQASWDVPNDNGFTYKPTPSTPGQSAPASQPNNLMWAYGVTIDPNLRGRAFFKNILDQHNSRYQDIRAQAIQNGATDKELEDINQEKAENIRNIQKFLGLYKPQGGSRKSLFWVKSDEANWEEQHDRVLGSIPQSEWYTYPCSSNCTTSICRWAREHPEDPDGSLGRFLTIEQNKAWETRAEEYIRQKIKPPRDENPGVIDHYNRLILQMEQAAKDKRKK